MSVSLTGMLRMLTEKDFRIGYMSTGSDRIYDLNVDGSHHTSWQRTVEQVSYQRSQGCIHIKDIAAYHGNMLAMI